MTQAKANVKDTVQIDTALSESQAIYAENRARRAQADEYRKSLGSHSTRSKDLFTEWKELRREEIKTRKIYANCILIFALIQSVAVYVCAGISIFRINATSLEIFGLVTLVCSQTFGLVFVVVKYFFGQKPEGLSEISRFINKTRPHAPMFRNKIGKNKRES